MLPFIRSDLAQSAAYAPHAEDGAQEHSLPLDHLDTNECPYDLPEEIKKKLAWAYQHEIESNRYPDGGHLALKQAIAEYVNESANLPLNQISADQITVGNGSDELIRSILIATCVGQEAAILVADPTFSMYAILAHSLGIPVISISRSEATFAMDLEAAQGMLGPTQNPPIRVVFVVHPNSPTANLLTPEELAWLSSLPEHILVVVDEAYFEFSQTTVVEELQQHPNWMVLRTFSKAFRLAAHRVGYAIAHPQMITILEKVRLPYNLPTYSQAAGLVALSQRHCLLAAVNQIVAEREQLILALKQFPSLKIWPSSANFIYLCLNETKACPSHTVTLDTLHKQLRAQGTLIRLTGGGLRITVGSSEENARTFKHLTTLLQPTRTRQLRTLH